MRSKIEELLKDAQSNLKYDERSLKSGLDKAQNDLERILNEAKLIVNDVNYSLSDKAGQIIHLIHWGIANMHLDTLSEKAGKHQATDKEIRTLNELLF